MNDYLNPAWREKMAIRWDYNHMMAEYMPENVPERLVNAITPKDIDDNIKRLAAAQSTLSNKWAESKRMMSWVSLPYFQKTVGNRLLQTAKAIRDRFDAFVVLGIGGSALGPIALQQALNHLHYNELPREQRGGPKLYVEDNVDPERMRALLDVVDLPNTIFNVITKSGSTSETMSQFMIITRLLKYKFGDKWKRHIILTTDKKSGNLIKIAHEEGLQAYYIPSGVGGRFSELSPVGLLPAAVCGIDIFELLAGADAMRQRYLAETDPKKNIAAMAALLAYLAMEKKGKNIQVVMPYADSLKYFADWYAQLWGESLGKKATLRGKTVYAGQTPVKSLGVTDQHSQVQLYTEGPFDKVITLIGVDSYRSEVVIPDEYMQFPNVAFLAGHTMNELISKEMDATEYALTKAGKLNQRITLPEVNPYTIGQLIYLFELQTALVGEMLNINAFDQPGVEEGKNATYALFGRPGYEAKRAELENRKAKSEAYILK